MAMLETGGGLGPPPVSSPTVRRHSKSPYRPRTNNDLLTNASALPRRTYSDLRTQRRSSSNNGNECLFSQSERRTANPHAENLSPFTASERRRYVSPLKTLTEANINHDASLGRKERSRRAASAPRSRLGVRSQHEKLPSVGEINEMVANANISKMMSNNNNNNGGGLDSMDSVSPGDIFFSRDYDAFAHKNNTFPKNGVLLPKPPGYGARVSGSHHNNTSTTNSSSVVSRQSSNMSDASGRTSASNARFVANRRKNHSEATWFFCIKKGSCKTSNKSPEKERPFDEASFISKAVVVESLRPLWADKHQPVSLVGFSCHKNEAQTLLQLVSFHFHYFIPYIY